MCIIMLILGVLVGSFLNVCIYRIPKKEEIVYTPSHCMYCGKRIKWYDLVPVLSFVILRRKCRYCKKGLSIQYPLVELINGLVYMYLYVTIGLEMSLLIALPLFSSLLVISIIDLQTRTIPNGLNVFIGILAIINLVLNKQLWLSYLIGFFVVSILFFLIAALTGGRGMGGGDIKLMAVAGLLLGYKSVVVALFISCIVATIIFVPIVIIKLIKKQYKFGTAIPFGPFLCVGIMTAYLYGQFIFEWYFKLYK